MGHHIWWQAATGRGSLPKHRILLVCQCSRSALSSAGADILLLGFQRSVLRNNLSLSPSNQCRLAINLRAVASRTAELAKVDSIRVTNSGCKLCAFMPATPIASCNCVYHGLPCSIVAQNKNLSTVLRHCF